VVWCGQAISLLGSQLVQFALVWWLTSTTGSATVLALASLAALLPQILIGPFAGTLVDRQNRRMIMIVADSGTALATLALAILFWLQLATVPAVYALLLLRATGAAFHWPAMQASTPLMVPEQHLARITGLNQTLLGVAGIVIPLAGALAVETLPMQGVLAIDIVTALPAIGSLLLIHIPQPPRQAAPAHGLLATTLWADFREGLRFVMGWRALLYLAGIGLAVHTLGRAAGALAPLLVVQHFGGGALQLGWWEAAAGIGTVLGGLVLTVWGVVKRRVVIQMVALMLDGAAILVIGLLPEDGFAWAVAGVFVTGFLEAGVLGLSGAIFMAIVPPEVQGRVFSLLLSVTMALAPIGLLVAGPFADRLGVEVWWVLAGTVILVISAGALFVPEIVHIEEQAVPTPSPA
jgi:DHA3 family macrolide efflux protein-like MFS transporter